MESLSLIKEPRDNILCKFTFSTWKSGGRVLVTWKSRYKSYLLLFIVEWSSNSSGEKKIVFTILTIDYTEAILVIENHVEHTIYASFRNMQNSIEIV